MSLQGNVDNPETPSSDEDNRRLKKNGFLSSFTSLVSDFTENIIKDFQGEEQLKGKIWVSDSLIVQKKDSFYTLRTDNRCDFQVVKIQGCIDELYLHHFCR